jgi:hypothetical protein
MIQHKLLLPPNEFITFSRYYQHGTTTFIWKSVQQQYKNKKLDAIIRYNYYNYSLTSRSREKEKKKK